MLSCGVICVQVPYLGRMVHGCVVSGGGEDMGSGSAGKDGVNEAETGEDNKAEDCATGTKRESQYPKRGSKEPGGGSEDKTNPECASEANNDSEGGSESKHNPKGGTNADNDPGGEIEANNGHKGESDGKNETGVARERTAKEGPQSTSGTKIQDSEGASSEKNAQVLVSSPYFAHQAFGANVRSFVRDRVVLPPPPLRQTVHLYTAFSIRN